MDPHAFDDLARLLGTGASRRRVLKRLLGGAVAALALRSGSIRAGSCSDAGVPCGAGLPDCCGGLECGATATCQPFAPQCGTEGASCIGHGDCCRGRCCDSTCHENNICCPTDFVSQSPDCATGETCDNNGGCVPIPCSGSGLSCGVDGDCCEGICCGGTCRSEVSCCFEDGYTSAHCGSTEFCASSGVCEPQPTCSEDNAGCATDDNCCRGVCCEGICQGSFQCCPGDGTPDPRCGDGMECGGGICQPAPPCLEPGNLCQEDDDCCEGATCVPYEDVHVCALPPCVGEGEACGGYVECCGGLSCAAASNTCVPEDVQVGPTTKEQCKHGGWKTYTNPSFKNQGDCFRFVTSQESPRPDMR